MSDTESAYAEYLRLRGDWDEMVNAPKAPMHSESKDALFDRLTRVWNRLASNEKRCAGMHCRLAYRR